MNVPPAPRRFGQDNLNIRPNYRYDDDPRARYSDPSPLRERIRTPAPGTIHDDRFEKDDYLYQLPSYKYSAEGFDELVKVNRRLVVLLERSRDDNIRLRSELERCRSKVLKYTDLAEHYRRRLEMEREEAKLKGDERDSEEDREEEEEEEDVDSEVEGKKERRKGRRRVVSRSRRNTTGGANDRPRKSRPLSPTSDDSASRSSSPALSTKETSSISTTSNDEKDEILDAVLRSVKHIDDVLSKNPQYMKVNPDDNSRSQPIRTGEDSSAPVSRERSSTHHIPSDIDILMTESSELRRLEEELSKVQEKLRIKRENEERKRSLQRQITEFQNMLNSTPSLQQENPYYKYRDNRPKPFESPLPTTYAERRENLNDIDFNVSNRTQEPAYGNASNVDRRTFFEGKPSVATADPRAKAQRRPGEFIPLFNTPPGP